MQAADLLFISNTSLRKKIVNAIGTISALYLFESDPNYSKELIKEVRRIIVLYSASVIEALLLYLYKKQKQSSFRLEYTEVLTLPDNFQKDPSYKLVIAKQVKIPKGDRELMLDVLLKIYAEKKVISKSLEDKIKKAKDVRNTFHLSKSRTGILVTPTMVKSSADALYETINVVKVEIEKVN